MSSANLTLTLKGLPPKLLRSLRAAAERERRSLNQQVIHLLEEALQRRGRAGRVASVDAQLAAWRKLAGTWQSDEDPATEAERLMRRRSPGREVDL
jgi:hypothetical protein